MSGSGWNNNIVVHGQRGQPDNVNFNSVGADYFKTMGTPVFERAGPSMREDTAGRPRKVAIVTEGLVQKTPFPTRTRSAEVFQIEEGFGAAAALPLTSSGW